MHGIWKTNYKLDLSQIFKNAFLNIQEFLFLSSAILFRALVTKLYVIISILLFLGFYFDFLKNEQPLIKKTNIKYLFY